MNDIINETMSRFIELEEKKHIQELKDKGIIADVCLIINSKHKRTVFNALNEMGIERIPIVWSDYVEEDKMYMVTDKETVEHIRQSLYFDV